MAGENIKETEGLLNPAVPIVQEDTRSMRLLSSAEKSISQPQTPKAAGFALSGMASVLGDAAHGLYTAKTTGLDEQMRRDIEKIKADRIDELKATNSAITGGLGAQVPPVGQPMPRAVAEVGDQLERLRDLRANGHISNSAYDGKLRMYLSDLRSQNPGFRDYIDDQGKKIIGYDPANQEIQQRVADINALGAKQLDERKWMLQEIAKNYPWMTELAKDVAAGKAGMIEFMDAKYPFDKIKIDAERLSHAEKIDAHSASLAVDLMADNVIHAIMTDVNVGQGTYTAKQLDENLAKFNRGEFTNDPQVWSKMGMSAGLLKERARRELMTWGTRPVTSADRSVTTYRTAMGKENFDKYVESKLEPLQKNIDMIKNQEFGPLNYQTRTSNYIKEGAKYGIYTDEALGRTAAVTEAMRTIMPETETILRQQVLQNPQLPGYIKGILALHLPETITDPNSSATKVTDALKKAGITSKQAYDKVFDWYQTVITNKESSQDTKEKAAWSLVKPENQFLIDQFQQSPGTVTDKSGVKYAVPAKFNYYFQLTSKDFATGIGKLSGQVQQAYRDRASEWLGDLFTTDALSLAQYHSKIEWDGKNLQFKEIPEKPTGVKYGTEGAGYADASVTATNRAIRRLNLALQGYSRVLDTKGGEQDKNVAVMQVLENMGVKISAGAADYSTEPEKGGLAKIVEAIKTYMLRSGMQQLPEVGEKPK